MALQSLLELPASRAWDLAHVLITNIRDVIQVFLYFLGGGGFLVNKMYSILCRKAFSKEVLYQMLKTEE